MKFLTKYKDTTIEQAFITSIDKVKGRIGLFLKNGLHTTGNYLYDINDLRVGISVIVSKVDGFYTIVNMIETDSAKKSYGRVMTQSIPNPNLIVVPPVVPVTEDYWDDFTDPLKHAPWNHSWVWEESGSGFSEEPIPGKTDLGLGRIWMYAEQANPNDDYRRSATTGIGCSPSDLQHPIKRISFLSGGSSEGIPWYDTWECQATGVITIGGMYGEVAVNLNIIAFEDREFWRYWDEGYGPPIVIHEDYIQGSIEDGYLNITKVLIGGGTIDLEAEYGFVLDMIYSVGFSVGVANQGFMSATFYVNWLDFAA